MSAPPRQATDPTELLQWPPEQAEAWLGLLATHRRLKRELDAELEAAHEVSSSALGLLTRLAAAPDGRLRLSALADQGGLSLSRVSRLVDGLEARGLVKRRPCPSDARATNAHLTAAGRKLAAEAQATHFAGVRRRFLDRLSPAELATLGSVFTRLAGEDLDGLDGSACPSGD